jgi:LysR family transcriptional regulator, benzoate and cis,cis-muconate-responsive activator of ben and cat genes
LELRQIDCFLAVATDLHFGKAAERLSLSQSSVSEAIRALEHEVGGPLFVRTSRRVQLTPLGEKLRRGVEPAALVLRATLEDCRKIALGKSNRVRIGFLGGGLYDLTLPFIRRLRNNFQIDVDWVELSLLDQFEAVAAGRVDAAFCRLPLSRDGLVQGAVLFESKRKLVVSTEHRLANRDSIDPEELARETLPTLPDDHQLGPWIAFHFPDHTPSGQPIARGPVIETVREMLAVVKSGEVVALMNAEAERYYSDPGIRYIDIDVPPHRNRPRETSGRSEARDPGSRGMLARGGGRPSTEHQWARICLRPWLCVATARPRTAPERSALILECLD